MSTTALSGRAIFVLGMHRSGTSCLIGCLEECGLALAEVNRSAPHNRKGNLENRRIMELQDELFLHNGGKWDEPPTLLEWTDEHRRRRDEILAEYRGLSVFGIKDPRTLVTLPFWRESDLAMSLVGSFRHPLAVAESLRKRDSFAISRGLELWADYNHRLIRWCSELHFDLVSFDLPQREYLSSVATVARRLDLDPPLKEVGFDFFEPNLRQPEPPEIELPSEVTKLYAELVRLSDRMHGG